MLGYYHSKQMVGQTTLDGVFTVSKKHKDIYCWMDWIISEGLPFNTVEKENFRKYSNVGNICINTLMKYIAGVKKVVQDDIKTKLLPDLFALIFDGWSDGLGGHYVGLFASFVDDKNVVKKVLLALRPLLDETSFGSIDYKLFIINILHNYGKEIDNVICIIGDNCNTNVHLAHLLKRPLVGCASHRFNLFVKDFFFHDPVCNDVSNNNNNNNNYNNNEYHNADGDEMLVVDNNNVHDSEGGG